jgi:HAD superfamily hydrolase (TIGR01549 family)
MLKAILFDFDMTLADSSSLAKRSYKELSKFVGIKPTKRGFMDYTGRRLSESLNFFLQKNHSIKREKLMDLFLKIHEENLRHIQVYGLKLLNYLKKHKIKIIIVSNNARLVIQKTAKIHKMHYNLIFADEDMKRGWEKHQTMLFILKKFKLKKNEVFYVGDHINDIKQARKAGIKIISVTTGIFSAKDLIAHKPDFIIKDLDQLRGVVEKNE